MNNNINKNNLSIIGFIFSFFIGVIGLILSILALKKSKETKSGRKLSIAGIIISSLNILFTIVLIVIIIPLFGFYYSISITDIDNKKPINIIDNIQTFSYNCEYANECNINNEGKNICKYDLGNGKTISIECE